MAGRYVDWRHTRVLGAPRSAGVPYLGDATKLLGEVFEQAAFNGLAVHKMQRKLPDGTVVIAEKHGEIPRMTIVPVLPKGQAWKRTLEGFYFTWAGAEPGKTPVVFIEPHGEEGEDDFRDWRASFFSADAVGYEDTPEDRRAGPYIDVFGVKAKTYGYRLLHGSGTWTDPETGEVVSWMRGYPSYWPQHYRHPITNYSNAVSIYGHIVFAVPVPEWRILAAAKRDGWLYVLIAEDLGHMEPPALSGVPAYSGQVWFSQPYTDAEYTYAVWRIPLGVVVEPDTGIETYRGDPDLAEKLWTAQLELAYGAWSFNSDCTELVTMQLPRTAVWCWIYEDDGSDWVPSAVEDSSYPQVEAWRIVVSIDHGTSPPTVSGTAGVNADLIAEEDGVQLKIVATDTGPDYYRNEYVCGDWSVAATDVQNSGAAQWYERRVLLHAHLPSRTFLFHRWRTDMAPSRHVTAGYELYVDGEQIELDDGSAIDEGISSGIYDSVTAGNFLYRKGTGYDDGAETSWFRPMDAMTFLLGFTFSTQGALPSTGDPTEPAFGYQGCPHVPFLFDDTGRTEHASAGGFIFGSVGGAADDAQFWGPGFTLASPYGANAGAYDDPAPTSNPTLGTYSAVSTKDNTLAAARLQPLLGVLIGGSPSDLTALANQFRAIRFGTNGDAGTLFTALLGDNDTVHGFSLSHTGKPRKSQQGTFEVPAGDKPS